MRVFVNPTVFGRLKERGAQVVMSHETTHVATDAPFATMPTWLLEGFADFVALDDAGVPVDLAAGQILARIRKEGLPDGLPSTQELDPTANGLGATYEEAWLACRFLAQEYGTAALVRFYRTVNDGGYDPAGVPQRAAHLAAGVRGAVARRPALALPGWQAERRDVGTWTQQVAVPVDGRGVGRRLRGPVRRVRALVLGARAGTSSTSAGARCSPPQQLQRGESYASMQRHLGWASLAVSLVVALVLGLTRLGARLVRLLPGPWWVKALLGTLARAAHRASWPRCPSTWRSAATRSSTG